MQEQYERTLSAETLAANLVTAVEMLQATRDVLPYGEDRRDLEEYLEALYDETGIEEARWWDEPDTEELLYA